MLALIGVILSALSLLIQWLTFHKHVTLTEKQRSRLNHLLFMNDKLRALSTSFGCSPVEDVQMTQAMTALHGDDTTHPEGF